MRVKYIGPFKSVQIAATGQVVVRGESVEVSAAVGRELAKQSTWKKLEPRKKKET